ncbi:hypothetical protein VKS41_003413 [Umbelopsis sp. WA50703]
MSSRALRKLQKEQGLAHLETLGRPAEDNDVYDESDEDVDQEVVSKPARNLFDLLDEGDGEEPQEEESEKEDEELPVEPAASPSKKKNKKKKGKKAQKGQVADVKKVSSSATGSGKGNVGEMSLEELDKLLQKESKQNAAQGSAKASMQEGLSAAFRQVLAVDTRYLDADAEMKRMFGSKVVNKEKRERLQGRVLKKTRLATPKVDWSPYTQQGLSMKALDSEKNMSEFCYIQSESYQDAQLEFLECVESHDPNNIVLLNRYYPYHIDCLLQISEIAKHSGDWTVAGECIAIHRHIQFLSRRGCWRTAFEFNKLLLSLDPLTDPLCSKLSIDFYALKCNEHDYFLNLFSASEDVKQDKSQAILPNFAFSRAYAMFKLENQKKKSETEISFTDSSQYLQKAILTYPMVVLGLTEKCGHSDNIIASHSLMSLAETGSPYLNLLIQLFVQRNFTLWKEPEVMEWLIENTHTALARFDASSNHADPDVIAGLDIRTESVTFYPAGVANDPHHGIPLNVSRHILISDIERLLAFIPDEIKQRSHHMHDPLPPLDSISSLGDVDTPEARERQRTRRVLRPGARGNLLDMLNNMLVGPGGGRLGQEATQRLREMIGMLEQQQMQPLEQDRFPGAFPEDDDDIATPVEGFEHVEDAGDENANAGPGLLNFASLRNTLNRYLYAQDEAEDNEALTDEDIALQMALQDDLNAQETEQGEGESSQPSNS